MAKRTRYGNKSAAKRAARPNRPAGAPRPNVLSARPPAPADEPLPVDLDDDAPMRPSSASLTEAEERRAAELEAEANARERAAVAESLRRRARAQGVEDRPIGGDVNAPLSVRMSHEYAYVARDVKRIALTASLMVGILAVLHILVNVMGVITL
jgi:nucleotide-binding universal stress UspA family protein